MSLSPSPVALRVIATLRDLGCRVEPCGSQVTCLPAPTTGTDIDYLVEVPSEAFEDVIEFLHNEHYLYEGDDSYDTPPDDSFASWKRDAYPEPVVNLLLTTSPSWAEKHRVATHLCTRLNLLHKPDRLAVFQAVLYTKVYIDRLHMGVGVNSPWAAERKARSAAEARQGE
jgi:hypothetical protein